ncbi:DUF4431 domain-containing protein [Pelodictyon phaeoclathratiforme]|jgi:hypothetical protein|uniref:DUF4431 domain-containing protein n=1 Tax=Pelodictyon phaeoclathratiforme (strain DSM 5477 / BU-1) TaxID=324925 RepID=B4SCA6_PELPB|nr:DUF4431 domain-containing protein [Pelodictyon phaeoclathratiforme]ACF42686.1 hypothetical protein Ppha_0355 [Pelodictyon phaeoclathratiforme BU-1]MBV5288460.1 DUF4431 domain-containing protein [Pelodictyon phaeoclathratiforme]
MKLKLHVFLSVALCLACSDVFAQSYRYDVPVTLEGVLVSSIADPEITYDEKSHQFPAVRLHKSISVLCAPTETDCQPELGVTLLHLVLKKPDMAKFKSLKGKPVKLNGTLFHSDNGHHFTSVLLDVGSIIP